MEAKKLFDELCQKSAKSTTLSESIAAYNKMGFLTHASQPGNIQDIKQYMLQNPHIDYNEAHRSKILASNTCVRKQRATVWGVMEKSMANKVYELLKDDKNLLISTSVTVTKIDVDCPYGSCVFFDEVQSEGSNSFDNPDNLELFPINMTFEKSPTCILCTHKLLRKYVVEVDIMERRWNDNTYLWTKLLDVLGQVSIN